MSSLRAKIIRAATSAYVQRVDVANINFVKTRGLWDRLAGMAITAFGVRVEKDTINGLHAEWLTPKNYMDGKLLLYLHGGGYVVGGCDMHRQMVSHIARAGRIRALYQSIGCRPSISFRPRSTTLSASIALF